MAKNKDIKGDNEDLGVYKENDKYFCKECNTEIPIRQACPNCDRHVDWDRVLIEMRGLRS